MAFSPKKDTISLNISDALRKDVGKALAKGITTDYVDTIKDKIVTRTRLGVGVDPVTGNGIRLPALSTEYIKRRKGSKIAKKNKIDAKRRRKAKKSELSRPNLASITTPSKSNLTATGQLLNALHVVKLKIQGGVEFSIRIADKRGRDLFGKISKVGNKDLVGYLAGQGRHFFGLTRSQKKQISKEIRQIIRKFL